MKPDVRALGEKLKGANEYTCSLAAFRLRWIDSARSKQIAPPGDWDIWLILAGRGFGKTRTGAETLAYWALSRPKTRWAVVAPTQNDVRSVCFEGESGLLAVIPKRFVKRYSSTDLEIELVNGSLISGYSAEKPDRLRGPQFHGGWGDELASWGAAVAGAGVGKKKKDEARRLVDTWDNLWFGMRLGDKPRLIVTTTPRPLEFLRKLRKNPRCHTTTGSTFDNKKNLAATSLAMFQEVYGGTRKGRQELDGEILDDVAGALWNSKQIDKLRDDEHPALERIVIAIDPAVTSEEQSDETGIIVAGLADNGKVYLLEDLSGQYTPNEWANVALKAYERFEADCVVGETNQGGDLVEANLRAEADGVYFRFVGVHAKRGKYLRAEPVAALYEKGKVRHVGTFPELESQMCNFVGSTGAGSPDRLDALVYAVGELAIGKVKHAFW